jgi:GMP synthase PP-ATPase subunit
VVFLGDSTMQESFVDILVKLSAVTDDEEIRAYLLHLFQSYFHREWARNLTMRFVATGTLA